MFENILDWLIPGMMIATFMAMTFVGSYRFFYQGRDLNKPWSHRERVVTTVVSLLLALCFPAVVLFVVGLALGMALASLVQKSSHFYAWLEREV